MPFIIATPSNGYERYVSKAEAEDAIAAAIESGDDESDVEVYRADEAVFTVRRVVNVTID